MTTRARDSPNRPAGAGVHDLHAHILPRALLRPGTWTETWPGDDHPVALAEAETGATLRIGDRLLPPAPAGLTDPRQRLTAMDEAGIDVQVVSPWMELTPVGLPPDRAVAYVRTVNDALAQEVAERPERLVGMGMVPTVDGTAAAAELERVVDLGMCGVILPTSTPGHELSDPGLEPLWQAAGRRRALVMLHPFLPVAAPRLRREGLGDLVGTPLESAVAVGALLRAGVLGRHPDVRFCVVHGGGPLPALAGRLDALWRATGGSPTGLRPSMLLRRLHFDTLTHDDAALRWLAEFAGWGRLVLGSDFPFPTGDSDPAARLRRVTTPGSLEERLVLGVTLAALIADVRTRRDAESP